MAVKATLNDPEVDRVCTRRLLSHKLQIARYYRAAFFSLRYTRLYTSGSNCSCLILVVYWSRCHTISHFRCRERRLSGRNFASHRETGGKLRRTVCAAPRGLSRRTNTPRVLRNTRYVYARAYENTMYSARGTPRETAGFESVRKSVISVSFFPVLFTTQASRHQTLHHRRTALRV